MQQQVISEAGSGSPKKTLQFPPGSMMKAAAGMAKTHNFEGVLQGQKMKLKNSEF